MNDQTVMTRPTAGWPLVSSPYHSGEMEIQTRVGWRDRAEKMGRRVIRDYMPEQHRQFFETLPYVVMGSLDTRRRPWASVLTGGPGFIRTPDPRTIAIDAMPITGDPAREGVYVGAPVGFVGIDLQTRRRNRLTGRVTGVSADGFQVAIDQSFGNCPQYIQARAPAMTRARATPGATTALGRHLSPLAIRMITAADTLFIASTSPRAGSTDPREGADANHRGGKPGFVKVTHDDGRAVLTIPDFSGNRAFNTLGNILLYPRAGLLFADFASGDLLSLTGTAEIIWEGPEVTGFAGAERLLRVTVEEAHHIEAGLPFDWSRPQPAPQLDHTGEWTT
jgi:uncharacterized protein